MSITYELGSITIDGWNFNSKNFSEVLARVFTEIYSIQGYNITPSTIIFHECIFKDTYMQLVNDINIVGDTFITYYFTKGLEMFQGEYPLNLNIKFELCRFYNVTFTSIPFVYVGLYNNDHKKLANVSIFIESIKLPYADYDDYPSWQYDNVHRIGYKILRENISSHVKKYYLCQVSIPDDADAIRVVSGQERTNKIIVNSIVSLIEINSYKYADDEVFSFIPIEKEFALEHYPFAGRYNYTTLYATGGYVEIEEGIETNSYKSFGTGIYFVNTIEEALRYLNRVIPKEQLIYNLNNGEGKIDLITNYLLTKVPEISEKIFS